MSKWRPRKEGCIYIIPDIHGASQLLDSILKRITPLRKRDKIVFLGDYVDRHVDSHKVIDTLIELKKKYKERVICLMGNHELMLLQALDFMPAFQSVPYMDIWMNNGAKETIGGYLSRVGMQGDLASFILEPKKIKRLIPKEHIDFMMNLDPFYEEGDFIFVHGGCHPEQSPSNYNIHTLCWDRTLVKLAQTLIDEEIPMDWEKIIITGHSTRRNPIVADKFLMLDIGSPRRLLVVEAHSREAFLAKPKKRLVKFELKNSVSKKTLRTTKTGPMVRRVK